MRIPPSRHDSFQKVIARHWILLLRTGLSREMRGCLRDIAAKGGVVAWQKSSGYTKRSRVETTIGRYKQVIGDGLRFHKDERRRTEVNVAVHVLNRMSKLGRPISIRIA
jgi:hypothetical protein